MTQKNSTQSDVNQVVEKIRRPKPGEFLLMMERMNVIEQAVKTETELYDLKIKSLELEKQYLWHIMGQKPEQR